MKYSYSLDNESFHGKYDSPQEAAAHGFFEFLRTPPDRSPENWIIFVGENRNPDLSCPIRGDDAINSLFDNCEDFHIEPAENFSPTKEQRKDLTDKLEAAWNSWISENEIEAGFHVVENVKEYLMKFSGKKPDDCGVFNFVEKQDKK